MTALAPPARPRRSRTVVLLVALTLFGVLAGAAGAVAAGRFADDIAGVHQPGVSFVADAGITTGCEDGSVYCPTDAVTRDQMATFMHRLSGNAPGVDPSVNAATLDGHTVADLQAAPGPAGPEGPQGPTGPQGPAGPAGQDAPVDLLPIAFGRVEANGSSANGTGNYSSSWNGTRYEISIDGVHFSGIGGYIALVTPTCSDQPQHGTNAVGGKLLVELSNQQCAFNFIVYDSRGWG